MDKETLIVDGFVFPSYKEAQTARREQKNIEIIREKTPLSDAEAVYELYTKLIERDMFKTMVGYSFLYELRHRLITEFAYDEASIPTLALPKRMEYDKVGELNRGVMENRIKQLLLVQKRMGIVIAALVIMIVGMFIIAAINPNAGYINTENKIVNKYSAWEEELEQREKAVSEREEQLKTDSEK